MNETQQSRARFVLRYVVAAALIPIGVALGVGGLAQNWGRKVRGRPRRSEPVPAGLPEDSGLRRVGKD